MSVVVCGPVLLWHVLVLAACLIFVVNRFDLMVDKWPSEPSAVVRHILLKDEDSALEMKKALSRLEGDALLARFSMLAIKSECKSGMVGGALGAIKQGQMAPAFDRVSFSAPVMELQGPVQTHAGFHLILVVQRSGMGRAAAAKIKDS